MPRDEPRAADLIDAVTGYLRDELIPSLRGLHRWEAELVGRLLRLPANPATALFGALILAKRIRPALRGWAGFQTLMAAHLLRTSYRELRHGQTMWAREADAMRALLGRDGDYEQLEAALIERIRDERIPLDDPRWQQTLAYLRTAATDRMRIFNPEYIQEP